MTLCVCLNLEDNRAGGPAQLLPLLRLPACLSLLTAQSSPVPLDSLTFLSQNTKVAGGLQMDCKLGEQKLIYGTMTHVGEALIGETDALLV